jgi:phytoene dehydrogenase-like protein
MGSLSEAIASAARQRGARILTGQPVDSILFDGNRATGVVVGDGTEIRSQVVLSNADPRVTFLRLLPENALPEDFRRHITSMDFSSAAAKINVALDRLPNFSALPGDSPCPQHHGTIHLASTTAEIEAAYHDAAAGRSSRRPVIEMTLPSALDSGLAPPGKHVMSLFIQYAPYTLAEGTWADPGRGASFADTVFQVIEEYAPGFTSSVVAREVLSPLDLERVFGLSGGNIFHGSMGLEQLFWLRPAPGWSRYRTPLPGLYLCGAGAHPGGGVLGAPGRNAAKAVLADWKRLTGRS